MVPWVDDLDTDVQVVKSQPLLGFVPCETKSECFKFFNLHKLRYLWCHRNLTTWHGWHKKAGRHYV